MRILIITNFVPYPLVSGAPLRTYNLLQRFARNHEVYMAAFSDTEEQREGIDPLLQFCRDVVTVNCKNPSNLYRLWKLLRYPFQGGPLELRLFFSEELARKIQDLVSRTNFDVIQIEHGSMGLYLEVLPAHLRKKAVWVLHDVDFDKFRRVSRIERRLDRKMRTWLHAKMMMRWQPSFAGLFGLCVTMSDSDRLLLLSVNKSLKVEVSPNGVDTHRYQPMPEEDKTPSMLFVGNMEYEPNVDAVLYFCQEVLPLIRNEIPNVELWIVGINPKASVKSLIGNGVFVTGGVPDVVPYYGRSKVCVVPLRAGSGTRLKILEAMAIGRSVVSTSIGCEGLDVVNGEHILIADDSKRFAEQTVELLRNPALRRRLVEKAREFVVASYDWDVIAEGLIRVFSRLKQ